MELTKLELRSIGRVARELGIRPVDVAKLAAEVDASPAVTLDGVPYFDRPTLEQLRAVRPVKEVKR